MTVRLALAPVLGERAGGRASVYVEGGTVGEALHALSERFPELRPLVWSADGTLNAFLVIFLDEQDIRDLAGLDTPLRDGQELAIVSALEGG